jgi:HEAT repeat protein
MTCMRRSTLAAALLTAGTALAAQSAAEWQDVIRHLRHPDARTRIGALERLGDAGYAAAAEPASALLADSEDAVQAAAIDAGLSFFLADRMGGSRVLGIGRSRSRAQEAFEAGPLVRNAVPAPPVLVDRLTAAIRDENDRIRFDAVHALGFIATPPLTAAQVEAIAAELDHYDPIIRAATARVLGRLHGRSAIDALLVALEDSNLLVRQFALEALGRLREPRVLGAARTHAASGGGDLAETARLAVARVGAPEDVPRLREWLSDRDAAARRSAAEGLGRAGDTESMAVLEDMVRTDRSPAVRLAARFALELLGQTQTHLLAAAAVGDTAEQAHEYLFEIGRRAVPGIQAALEVATDPRHQAGLAQLVGYLGGRGDIVIVEPLLTSGEERVRWAATAAIERLQRLP